MTALRVADVGDAAVVILTLQRTGRTGHAPFGHCQFATRGRIADDGCQVIGIDVRHRLHVARRIQHGIQEFMDGARAFGETIEVAQIPIP